MAALYRWVLAVLVYGMFSVIAVGSTGGIWVFEDNGLHMNNYFPDDKYIWDNGTNDFIFDPDDIKRDRHMFILKMTFFGGLGIGLLFSCGYAFIQSFRFFRNRQDEPESPRYQRRTLRASYHNGNINLGFEGEASAVEDSPPDYYTVMAQDAYRLPTHTFKNNTRSHGRKNRPTNVNSNRSEVLPPCYESVVNPKENS